MKKNSQRVLFCEKVHKTLDFLRGGGIIFCTIFIVKGISPMKKTFLIFLLIFLFCFSACVDGAQNPADTDANSGTADSNADGGKEKEFDLWAGVEGDVRELSIELNGSSMTAVLNKDETGRLDVLSSEGYTSVSADGYSDFDAEIATFSTIYGSYVVEENQIVVTCDAHVSYRIDVRGKDAEAFKSAYIEDMGEEYQDLFDKGMVMEEATGTYAVVLFVDGDACRIHTFTKYREDGNREEEMIVAEDGSWTETNYYENGVVSVVSEYSSEGDSVKRTSYNDDGSINFVSAYEYSEEGYVKTTTDANGSIISVFEKKDETLEDNYYLRTEKTTEQGVMTMLEIYEWYENEQGGMVIPNRYRETVTGNEKHIFIEMGRGDDWNYTYILEKAYVDDVITEYICRKFFEVKEVGDLYEMRVEYMSEMDSYSVMEYYYDGGGYNPKDNGENIPASEYVHADWETPTWPEF